MVPATNALRSVCAAVLIAACAFTASACRKTQDASFIGTFRMGEKVQIGPMMYQVLETQWRTELGGSSRAPQNRFLFVKVSIYNGAGTAAAASNFTLESGGKTYNEITENMEGVDNWLGLLRNVAPSQTEQGWVVFDAPIAAHKLVISHGEIGEEKFAHVDIPVQLE